MGTVHRFERTIPHSRNLLATAVVAGIAFHPVITPADIAFHPVITPADIVDMDPDQLLYFTDTPAAHVAAYRDFERELYRERRAARADETRFDRTPGPLREQRQGSRA